MKNYISNTAHYFLLFDFLDMCHGFEHFFHVVVVVVVVVNVESQLASNCCPRKLIRTIQVILGR